MFDVILPTLVKFFLFFLVQIRWSGIVIVSLRQTCCL